MSNTSTCSMRLQAEVYLYTSNYLFAKLVYWQINTFLTEATILYTCCSLISRLFPAPRPGGGESLEETRRRRESGGDEEEERVWRRRGGVERRRRRESGGDEEDEEE